MAQEADRFTNAYGTWATSSEVAMLLGPITRAEKVVNAAADTLTTFPTRALYVGVSGDVVVDLVFGGTAIPFRNAAVGWHPIRATKIYSTANGTSASFIVACM